MEKVHQLQKDGIHFLIGIPAYPLQLWIDHFFVAYGNPSFTERRVFPNNHTDLFFNLGSLNRGKLQEQHAGFEFRDSLVSGLRSSYMMVQPTGYYNIAGMRFRLFGFSALFGIPAIEIANENLCAADVLGPEIKTTWQRLGECSLPQERLQILEQWMEQKALAKPFDIKLWNRLEQRFKWGTPNLKTTLANELGYSYKHSLQLITQKTGLHPKLLERIYRVNSLLKALATRPQVHWAGLAYSLGYSDQSHMIREFKTFTGFTPSEFQQTRISNDNYLRLFR